jgi:hypothetical protein
MLTHRQSGWSGVKSGAPVVTSDVPNDAPVVTSDARNGAEAVRRPHKSSPALLSGKSASEQSPEGAYGGGSIFSAFTATFLRQIGWDVDVYERSRVEPVGRGAGITGLKVASSH